MASVLETGEFRGVTRIVLSEGESLRVCARHFRAAPLAPGDEVDREAYVQRVARLQQADAYEAALRSLDVCARTRRELSRSLAAKGYLAPAIEATLERLARCGLIDDGRYARRAVEGMSDRAVGVYAARRKLRAKGIGEADVEAALEVFDEKQQRAAARAAAAQLARRYEGLPAREAKAKLSQALARRGFAWDVVGDALEALFADEWD